MNKEAIYHQIDSSYAYALSTDQLLLKLRTKKNDLRQVAVIHINRYAVEDFDNHLSECTQRTEMKKTAFDHLFDYYETVITVEAPGVIYLFELNDGREVVYYGHYQFMTEKPTTDFEMFAMNSLAEKDIFQTPEWGGAAIVYQIFPERFHSGNPSLHPNLSALWDGRIDNSTLLGGDLVGIIHRLDYLENLGINVIYLTPIFTSPSNHKYDTIDYFTIDPQFGTLETLQELVREAHIKGIRVILDGVFNHVSYQFPPFQDAIARGAESPYYGWFDIRSSSPAQTFKPGYACFANNYQMPKIMTKNPEVAEYFLKVGKYWIEAADIDGWRIDCANEVDHAFWREFRNMVKKSKPDAMFIAEIWHEANTWLQGDQFDTSINYPFYKATIDFIAQTAISAGEFAERLGFLRGLYKRQAHDILWNIIDTHDTVRFLTSAGGSMAKLKLAVLLQMTYPGIPVIYYGDEIGMPGGPDPDNRRGMTWEPTQQNQELFTYYQKLIKIRKTHPVFQHGSFTVTQISNAQMVYGYSREYHGRRYEVILNNSPEPQTVKFQTDVKTVIELINDQALAVNDGVLHLIIPAQTGMILSYQ